MLHRHRFLLHNERGDVPSALAELETMLGIDGISSKDRAKAHRDRGRLLARSGQRAAALMAYDASLQASTALPEAWLWRSEVLLQMHRPAEAAAGFDRCLVEGGKPDATLFRGRATARSQMGEHQAALSDFNMALRLAGDVSLRLQRGRSYLACEAWLLAVEDFTVVLERDASVPTAYHGRGLARLRLGSIREAAEDAENLAVHAGNDLRHLHAAACLMAQAAGRIVTGRDEAAARQQRARYQERAVALLRQTIESLPAGDRPRFWRDRVQGEAAFRPVWSRNDFVQLEKRCRQPGTTP